MSCLLAERLGQVGDNSATSSMPTERRIRPGAMPAVARSASVWWLWIIEAGWVISVSMPPRLTARVQTRVRPITR